MATKRNKFRWNIRLEMNYDGGEKTYLVVDLNGGLNSAIPLVSEGLEAFKDEKLTEIKFFEGSNLDHIEGAELLGYTPTRVDDMVYLINDTEVVGGMLLRHIESGDIEKVVRYGGELYIDGKVKSIFPLYQFDLRDFEIVTK